LDSPEINLKFIDIIYLSSTFHRVKARFLERKLMRMPQMWTLPTAEDPIAQDFADHAIQCVIFGASG
jgi:hypothetical protein